MTNSILKLIGLFIALGLIISYCLPDQKNSGNTTAGVTTVAKQPESKTEPQQPRLSAADEARQVKEATKGLVVNHDKVKGNDWYEPKGLKSLRSGIYAYIGKEPGHKPWLRLVLRYHGSTWVFANKVLIRADDALYTFTPKKWDHDSYTTVIEEADMSPTTDEISILQKIIASKETILRFEGASRVQDITVSANMKHELQFVLVAFTKLGGSLEH